MKSELLRPLGRSDRGQNTAEFAAAFTVLIVIVCIPLVNLAAVPIRTGLAQAIVKDTVKNLSLSEKFSDAIKSARDGTLQQRLAAIGGVEVSSVSVTLQISKVGDASKFTVVERAGAVPKEWQPDGVHAPTSVEIVLAVQSQISPLVLGSSLPGNIPGLTVPFAVNLVERAAWENLGRDPNGGEYFLNE